MSGNPQWSTLLGLPIMDSRGWSSQRLVLLRRERRHPRAYETTAVQSGTSASATSPPAEAVQAVGKGVP